MEITRYAINCKVELSLEWKKDCILCSVADNSTFEITDTKLCVPVVTLKTEDNAKLSKLLSEGLKDQSIGMNIK